jgi:hypothetical protein
VPQRFLLIREERFTVAFREAITIAAGFARSAAHKNAGKSNARAA